MSDTKIKTSNIGNLAVTHALLHTDMDLTSKTVQVAAPSSNTHPATKLYVDTEVANLIDSAPGTLDTLNELAAAINDDANFNATIASSIATKLPLSGGTLTGNLTLASTASGSSASPEFELRRDITGADANYIGQIKFTADNDADQNTVFAKITGKILDASDGTEDGIIEFAHKKAGSNNISARFRSDSLQLINGTNLTVAGTTELTGNVFVGGASQIDSSTLSVYGNQGISTTRTGSSSFIKMLVGSSGESRIDTANASRVIEVPSSGSEVVFNEGSLDRDFRVESNNNANMLFVDAGNDRISVGSGSTYSMFNVISSNDNTSDWWTNSVATQYIQNTVGHPVLKMNNNNSNRSAYVVYNGNGSAQGFHIFDRQNEQSRISAYTSSVVINEAGTDVDFRVESDSNTHMLFVDAGSNEVGIGTSDPRSPLHVQTSHSSTDVTAANTNSTLSIGNSATGNGVYNAIKFAANQQDMYIMSFNNTQVADRRLGFFLGSVAGDAVADERLSIRGNGNVGIGTTSPSTKLTVRNDNSSTAFGGNNILTLQNLNTTDNNRYGIGFTGNTNIGSGLALIEAQSYDQSQGHTSLNFSVYNGSWHEDMMVLKAGNVGIGTTGPNESLHVYRSSGDASFKLQNSSQTLRIDQNSIRSTTNHAIGFFTNNNSSQGFRIENDGRMIIGDTSGQTNVKLTVAGNVKMGSAATSSWANTVNDVGGLDVIVGSGSHLLNLWDDNRQSSPRFEVERAGRIISGPAIHIDPGRHTSTYNVSGSAEAYNLMMPSFYGSGSINQTYRHAYNIDTPFHTTLWQGGGGNTVFTTWSKIGAEHYKDIYIETYTLFYSDIKIKVITDGNTNQSVWYAGATYSNNVYSARWRVYPLQACTITMNPSSSQSAVHMVHQASGGRQESSTDTATAGSGPSTW